jgi:hypothetical protein
MSVTVADFLQRVAIDLQENPASFPPGANNLWNLAEMLDYIDYAERDFMRRTGIRKDDVTVPIAPGSVVLFNKPVGVMDIERVSFDYKRLRRVSTWDLEREDRTWRTHPNGSPNYYHEDHLPINQFELDHVPVQGGSYRMFCDTLPPEHTTNLNELIAVNDCWEPYIRWEVVSLALGKDGDNQDTVRSSYAHQRYLLGVALAKRFVLGNSVVKFPEV